MKYNQIIMKYNEIHWNIIKYNDIVMKYDGIRWISNEILWNSNEIA